MARNYQVGLIIKGNAKGGVTAVKATTDELTKLNAKQKRVQGETKKTSNSIGKMTNEFNLLKTVISGVGISLLTNEIYQGIDSFQKYQAQLKTITGSWDGAGSELNRLIDISKETPFTLQQSVDGFTKLTHLGLNPSKESMISYGNTASAMGKDLMQMIEAVADASVGEFERLKEFGIKAKSQGEEVTFSFQGQAVKVSKNAADIQKYLLDIGNTKFGTAMADQMNTLSAKSSNLAISLDQLYNKLGDSGVSGVFGDTLDFLAIGLDKLNEKIPVLVPALLTLAKVIAVGGVIALGLKSAGLLMGFVSLASKSLAINIFATAAAYAAGVGPVALFTTSLTASVTATKAAIIQAGLLKSALSFLFAAYAGWEIGTYIREQFVEARVAGLAFVGVMENGLVNITYAFSTIAPKAKEVWSEIASYIQSKLGAVYKLIADGFSKIGWDDTAAGYNRAAASMNSGNKGIAEAAKELKELEAKRKKDIKTIDEHIVALISYELALNKSEKTNKPNNVKSNVVQSVSAELSVNQKLISSIGLEIKTRQLSDKQRLISSNLSKLSVNATQAEINAVISLTNALYEQSELQNQAKSDDSYYEKIINGAQEVGDSWTSASNVIVNSFGTIGEQLDKLSKKHENYAQTQTKLEQDKLKYADNPERLIKIQKAEEALANSKSDSALSEIGSYRAITDSAANMFNENSKGRKAMQAASDVFTAVELANSAIRLGSYAVEAVAAAFAAPWPIGFASGAAMIAIMAGLGVSVSGGSGAPPSAEQRQSSQGTGTVLGSDEKSQSIANASARIEELELDQYHVLREMNSGIRDLNTNITHLTSSLVVGFGRFDEKSYSGDLGKVSTTSKLDELLLGGVFGQVAKAIDPTGIIGKVFSGFSSKKKTLVDSGISIVGQTLGDIIENGAVNAQAYFDIKTKKKSFWGLSSSTSTKTEYQNIDEQSKREIALIFENIGSSINSAVDVLGFDVTRSLDNFVIALPNISFKDLSGDEIQKELEAIFSNQADLMATYLNPGLIEFQKVGEGLYDTLLRIAQQQAVFNSVLELTGNTLTGIDAQKQTQITQNIIDFSGSLENLQSASKTYFSEFYSEAEQFTYLQNQLTGQFTALNSTIPSSREEFKKLVSGLDLTVEADQRLYASLLSLVPQMVQYYDALEKGAQTTDVVIDKEKELIKARAEFNQNFSDQLNRLDMSPLVIKLADLQSEFNKYRTEAIEIGADTTFIEALYGRKRQAIINDALTLINNTHTSQMSVLTNSHKKAVDELISDNAKFTNSLRSVNASVANNILSLRRKSPGFSEVSYQKSEETRLRGLLGQGDTSNQLDTISQLNDAIWNKYNAEVDHNNRINDLASEKHQADVSRYEELLSIANSLKEASKSLKFGALSTLSTGDKFDLASSDFAKVLGASRSGNAEAAGQLQGSGESYLALASQMFGGTASAEYQNIFSQVTGAFESFSAGSKPSSSATTARYQESSLAFNESTLIELEELRTLTAELEKQQQATFEESMSSLNSDLVNQTLTLENALSLQTSDIVNSINNIDIPIPVAPVVYLPPVKASDKTTTPDRTEQGENLTNEKLQKLVYLQEQANKKAADDAQKLQDRLEALEMRQAEVNSRTVYRWQTR